MAPSEAGALPAFALEVMPLTPADVAAGLALSDLAGWNQTADDWAFIVTQGHGVGCRDRSGRVVATAAALPYGGGQGWVSMVLVADEWRHRGLAGTLVEVCLHALRRAGVAPVLDATAAGAPVYRRLGFVDGFALERWEGIEPDEGGQSSGAASVRTLRSGAATCRVAGPADLDTMASLDRSASGLDRRALFDAFLRRPDTRAWLRQDGSGFVVSRAGRRARQIGPLVAATPDDAIALLDSALRDAPLHGPALDDVAARHLARSVPTRHVFLDVPVRWTELAEWLEERGFVRQRGFVRMALGSAFTPVANDHSFVLAGPEFG